MLRRRMSIFILLYLCVPVRLQGDDFDFNNFNENSNIDDFNPDMNFKLGFEIFIRLLKT